eukprot:CAMPEP_0172458238 /NCGR_PEP_ID=MMETSP1065-20121228/26533_1 /TAXON_ID=265537 /ORGANISM="Amphiprora paludosa, Strain CCMP125" /LENGTH=249 /DNA_ID=CAMNT_0013212389 /DNA_START=73 /DNA_END=822 /DNA_ORIENTATION=-
MSANRGFDKTSCRIMGVLPVLFLYLLTPVVSAASKKKKRGKRGNSFSRKSGNMSDMPSSHPSQSRPPFSVMPTQEAATTTAPSKQAPPTTAPSKQASPTTAPTTTPSSASPTTDNFPTVLLQEYEVLYTLEQTRFALPSEYEEVTSVTVSYVNDTFFDAFDSAPLVKFRGIETEQVGQDFSFGDPVVIFYQTTLTFTQDSMVPEESELNQILADSFLPPNDEVYRLLLVDSLVDPNLFLSTSVIGFQFS